MTDIVIKEKSIKDVIEERLADRFNAIESIADDIKSGDTEKETKAHDEVYDAMVGMCEEGKNENALELYNDVEDAVHHRDVVHGGEPVPEAKPLKTVKYDPSVWRKYWDGVEMFHTESPNICKFEHPEKFRLPVSKSIPVMRGRGIDINGKDWVGDIGAIIPEHKKNLIDHCKSMRLTENGFRLMIGEPNIDIFHGTNIFEKHGDVKPEGWSFQHQMLYGQAYNFNKYPDKRITKPVLPGMLWCYLEITDYEKASKYLENVTEIPCVVVEDMLRYSEDYKIKQVVDRANKYVIYWQLHLKQFSKTIKNSYDDMILDDI